MKRIFFTLLFTLLSYSVLFAAHDPVSRGAKAAAMGGASVANVDFWGVFNNPAVNAYIRDISAGAYFENRYLLKELSYRGLGVVLPVAQNDAFALNVQQFGYAQYLESKVGLAYSKKFGESFSAGLQFDYLNTFIGEGIGNKHSFTFEFGLFSRFNKKLSLGFMAFNPARMKLSDYNGYNDYIPVILKLGARYEFSERISAISEVEKDIYRDFVMRFGLDYKLTDFLYVRGGLSTGVVAYSFGVGLDYHNIKFDISTSVHQVLGPSPQISLMYSFNKKSEKSQTNQSF
ncbi:MAG: hypothetical protein RBS19_06925 [Bacteroidales bacterium]|nr:hypothetical protein [Bacteroidales bacterium]MDY0216670.1 hypothetical protein [Bacteroidales bacterium]